MYSKGVASGADRHLDIGLQVVEAHHLFLYFLEKRLTIPSSPFLITSKWFFCYLFPYFFEGPLPSFNWWAVSVGGEELKGRQLAHHQLMSQQGPHFSPHSKGKANYKSANLRKIGTCQLLPTSLPPKPSSIFYYPKLNSGIGH